MKLLSILLFSLLGFTPANWLSDFDQAEKIAKENHRLVLVSFSGSDWCAPCMRMRKEIFESDAFIQYAENNLVLVNADFPRKKNKLSKEQIKQNEALAERFNKEGKFPLSILMTESGTILKQWEGFPNVKPEVFVDEITTIANAKK